MSELYSELFSKPNGHTRQKSVSAFTVLYLVESRNLVYFTLGLPPLRPGPSLGFRLSHPSLRETESETARTTHSSLH